MLYLNKQIERRYYMKSVVVKHPLIEHKLSIIRDEKTGTKEFRELAGELAVYLCYEAMKDAKTKKIKVKTPVTETTCEQIDETKYAFIPILRAGLGMVDGIIKVIPNAKIGHIGMYRDEETLEPVEYYFKAPKDIADRVVILLDPMIATGGSAVDAISLLKKQGVKKIKFLGLLGAPEGLKRIEEKHPDVQVYVAALDEKLNENGFIVPGLGDAGDRIFGTK